MLCLSEWRLDPCWYNTPMKSLILIFSSALLTISTAAQPAPKPLARVPDIYRMIISMVEPAFPETSAAAGADGMPVSVRVVIDESGSVLAANCSADCHPLLKDAAEMAARSSKYRPLMRDGQPVRYDGFLSYTYVVSRIDWARFGTSLESTRQFDNISLYPVAQMLSKTYSDEKSRLLALDTKGTELEMRWKVIREVEDSIRSKLKGRDLWRFETSMALRRVTFWAMAGERTNRVDLQKAISELPRFIDAAPEGVSAELIQQLTDVSKFKVSEEMPEKELREALMKMTRNIRID
jgi:hypothetical protein